jgi:hypothetical protein
MLDSRAVERLIIAGEEEWCCYADCDSPRHLIAWRARTVSREIIANVYVDGKWNRVEHFHPACYDRAGSPYGEPKKRARKTR